MESLGLDLSKVPIDLVLNLLNIVLLFLIVRTLAYKPIRKFMDARTERVNAEARAAEEKAAEAEKLKAEYTGLLENSEAMCQQQADEARKAARAEADQIVSEAHAQADAILEKARAQAKKEHDETLGTMRQDVVDLAFDISEKLLEHSITDADTKKLADRLIDSCAGDEESA